VPLIERRLCQYIQISLAATEAFQQTLLAFETLADPGHRALYDYRLFGQASHVGAQGSKVEDENFIDIKRVCQEVCEEIKSTNKEVIKVREVVRSLSSDLKDIVRLSKGLDLRRPPVKTKEAKEAKEAKENIKLNQDNSAQLSSKTLVKKSSPEIEDSEGELTDDFEEEDDDFSGKLTLGGCTIWNSARHAGGPTTCA